MRSFRDIKRKARRDLHRELQVPALYIADIGGPAVLVHVRPHTKFNALGDLQGTNFNYAEREEPQPRIIFMRDEVMAPKRGAIISVEPGEAYRVDHTQPADDISITAYVIQLTEKEAVGLPVPGGSDG